MGMLHGIIGTWIGLPLIGRGFWTVSYTHLKTWRRVPELRTVNRYGDHPLYIAALAASIREAWATDGRPDRLLLSFHGILRDYADKGDPYPDECRRTAGLLAAALGLGDGQWAADAYKRQVLAPPAAASVPTKTPTARLLIALRLTGNDIDTVSYTHLDVYKRQDPSGQRLVGIGRDATGRDLAVPGDANG